MTPVVAAPDSAKIKMPISTLASNPPKKSSTAPRASNKAVGTTIRDTSKITMRRYPKSTRSLDATASSIGRPGAGQSASCAMEGGNRDASLRGSRGRGMWTMFGVQKFPQRTDDPQISSEKSNSVDRIAPASGLCACGPCGAALGDGTGPCPGAQRCSLRDGSSAQVGSHGQGG